jgi:hypothetical protein
VTTDSLIRGVFDMRRRRFKDLYQTDTIFYQNRRLRRALEGAEGG